MPVIKGFNSRTDLRKIAETVFKPTPKPVPTPILKKEEFVLNKDDVVDKTIAAKILVSGKKKVSDKKK